MRVARYAQLWICFDAPIQLSALRLLEANYVPGRAPIGWTIKTYTRRCTSAMEMARLVLLRAIFAVVMELAVEEARVTSWNDSNEQLCAAAC